RRRAPARAASGAWPARSSAARGGHRDDGASMTPRTDLADQLLRRFAASVRSAQLYSKGHPIIVRNMAALSAAVQQLHALEPAIVIAIDADEIIVGATPTSK